MDVVDLSRLQFALTALYHFLFVPLTLGLAILLGIMETVYVMTKKTIWRDMTKFWGILFGINFAMGVATGITMEFQFGTNWSYYSHFVGDVFGVPLAIEGLMAFFLEATFVGLFFFGWERLSARKHLLVTWLLAFGTNMSALWILIANGWMQFPVGAKFNFATMRMEVTDFMEIFFNRVAQAKFVHTVSAGYVVASVFVLSISSFYLLAGRHRALALRSIAVAASFGLLSSLSVVVLGDESGYTAGENQKMKIAAIEAMWETKPAPVGIGLFALPDQKNMVNKYEVEIPYLGGLIITRSLSKQVEGIKELVVQNEGRIRSGMLASQAISMLRADPNNIEAKITLEKTVEYFGYALLLKQYRDDVHNATDEQVHAAAMSTIPNVAVLFWAFRGMVACGLWFILLFTLAFWRSAKRNIEGSRTFLWIALLSLPLPWISCELGWIVAEYGRQPWVIDTILPTRVAASSTSASNVLFSLIGFVVFYSSLAIIDLYLMIKFIRLGPDQTLGHNVHD